MPDPAKALRVEYNLAWLPQPNQSQAVVAAQVPSRELVTTAFALAFAGDCLLMTNLRSRGWDIPGGHVEPGEHPEEAVRREVQEEAGATLGAVHLLGYQHLRLPGPQPVGYRYPYPDCYQAFYWAQVTALETFLPNAETQGRPLEARALSWVRLNTELYEAALAMVAG